MARTNILVLGLLASATAATGDAQTLLNQATGGPPTQQFGPAQMGSAVAGIGDLDADGAGDYLLGAPTFSPPTSLFSGRVSVRSGATGAELFGNTATFAAQRLGAAVVGLDDVSGDGLPDYAVGVPNNGAAVFPQNPFGEVQVRSGAGGALLAVLNGGVSQSPGDAFGHALAADFDITGDGISELIVGATERNIGAFPDLGYVQVYDLAGGVPQLLYTLNGTNFGDLFGSSVASTPDLTGDGVRDLIVGSPANLGFVSVGFGFATVFDGAAGVPVQVIPNPAPTGFFDAFGSAVAGIDDLTGNGAPDLLIGAPDASGGGFAAFVEGGTWSFITSVTGSAAGDRMGASIAARSGVFAQSGLPAFAIGAPGGDAGAGPNQGYLISSLSMTSFPSVNAGTAQGDRFGEAVAFTDDANCDGFTDVVVGMPGNDTQQASYGAANLLSGNDGALLPIFSTISAAAGGAVTYTLTATPAHAGGLYLMVGSLTGTNPGSPIDCGVAPVVFDAYTNQTLTAPNTPPLTAFSGTLGPGGTATGPTFSVGGGVLSVGMQIWHAFVATNPVTLLADFASNPTAITVGP